MAKVYLSPSTQENNIGVGNYGTEEAYCNLVVDLIEKILIKHGVDFKRNDPKMTLEEVVRDSDVYRPDLHLAIHTNATGKRTNTNVKGCLVLIHKAGGKRETYGNIIYDRMSKLTPWTDRGIKYGENWFGQGEPLYELAYTDAPAVLVEIDFHDNPESVNWLLQNIQLVAQGLGYSILDCLKIPIQPEVDYELQIKELSDKLDCIQQVYKDFKKIME